MSSVIARDGVDGEIKWKTKNENEKYKNFSFNDIV